ncbi:hypothetical protein AAMO2058_000007100 [Amorphochlora amoebiformis]
MATRERGEAEMFEVIYEISKVLNCGLDRQTLSILVSLCENGVNPEALAAVITELRRETAALKQDEKDVESKD